MKPLNGWRDWGSGEPYRKLAAIKTKNFLENQGRIVRLVPVADSIHYHVMVKI